ncbi:Glycosyltransferase [Lactococcus cremoris]|uniref:Glycosyltransferase n=1 Tax=Lactococcus lactis subsp. cremoris TaxID=1359 RepID=A0A166K4L4_LACLC|nr:glycosyltransferase family 2 protein [Lactococcus cremoris]KZK07631.1 Glycosyltransferase [Lactococcus cremoris]
MKNDKKLEYEHFHYPLDEMSWKTALPTVTKTSSEKITENPKVSVIIANYNNAPYLERMMESLVHQTLGIENIQVLFVDDRSTDNSLELIKPYCQSYPNIEIYLLDKNTGGAHGPRNVGILHARGDYLVILDADDWYAADGLENLYQLLEKSGDGIAFGGVARSKNGQLDLLSRAYIDVDNEISNRPISDLPYDFYNWLGPQGNMVRHSLVKENNLHFIDQRVADDVTFFYQALQLSQTISQTQKITTYVNRDDDNISLSKNINETFLLGWLRSLSYMLANYPDTESLQKFITRRLEWLLVDFTLRWDTKYGLSLVSLHHFRELLADYLSDLTFNPEKYFSLDIYSYIWQFLQAEEDEKLLKFVAWHTLPSIDKQLEKIDALYYFVPEDKNLPSVNLPLIKGKKVLIDDKEIKIHFDYYIAEDPDYIEFRNDSALDTSLRKKAHKLSEVSYETQMTRAEYEQLKAGDYKVHVVLKNQTEYLIAIDQLQIYCGADTLLSDREGVLALHKIADTGFYLAFKALDPTYLGQFIKVLSTLDENGDFIFELPHGEKISLEKYNNSLIAFPQTYDSLSESERSKKYSCQAGIYRLVKEMTLHQENETTELTLKVGTVLTVTHVRFDTNDEVLLVTSLGQVKFDASALEAITEPVEVVALKNIYSYSEADFSKEAKKKHYLQGTTLKVSRLDFSKSYRPRLVTEDGNYITENPNFVAFTANGNTASKPPLWQVLVPNRRLK